MSNRRLQCSCYLRPRFCFENVEKFSVERTEHILSASLKASKEIQSLSVLLQYSLKLLRMLVDTFV